MISFVCYAMLQLIYDETMTTVGELLSSMYAIYIEFQSIYADN